MEQVVQQNAAVVEQVAATAETVQAHARRLFDSVSVFKIADDAVPGRTVKAVQHAKASQSKPVVKRGAAPENARADAAMLPKPPKAVLTASRSGRDDGEWKEF